MRYGYSLDLRERVLSFLREGHFQREASKVFKLSRQTIYNWLCLKSEPGHLVMRRSGNRSSLKIEVEGLRQAVALYPAYYLWELARLFKVTPRGIYRALTRYKITRKKRRFSSRNVRKASVRNF